MPLGKNDNPTSAKAAKADIADAGAGAPAGLRDAAEALPEGDPVEVAYKDAMTATSVSEEVAAKIKVVDESPDAADTPSGGALKAVAGISDPVEQGEAYAREKSARRFGYARIDDKK